MGGTAAPGTWIKTADNAPRIRSARAEYDALR